MVFWFFFFFVQLFLSLILLDFVDYLYLRNSKIPLIPNYINCLYHLESSFQEEPEGIFRGKQLKTVYVGTTAMQVQREQWEFSPETILVVSLHSNSLAALLFPWITKYFLHTLRITKSLGSANTVPLWMTSHCNEFHCMRLKAAKPYSALRTPRTLWHVTLRKGWAFFFAHWLVFLLVSTKFSFHKMKKKLKRQTSYFCFFFGYKQPDTLCLKLSEWPLLVWWEQERSLQTR